VGGGSAATHHIELHRAQDRSQTPSVTFLRGATRAGGAGGGRYACPPHDWGCPVILKLDPDHVAWTCGRCGALANTDDPAVRPA
jgi:hypothetical protein